MKNKESLLSEVKVIKNKLESLLALVSSLEDGLSKMELDQSSSKTTSEELSLEKKYSSNKVIRRLDDEKNQDNKQDSFEQKKYDIKVIGLGVEKF